MVSQELRRQRENTETCLAILTKCQTRDEIVEGLGLIAQLLRQSNDPVARAAEVALENIIDLPDEQVLQVRDEFISQFRAFLSATESGAEKLSRAAREPTKRKIKSGWLIAIIAIVVVAAAICCVAAVAIFMAGPSMG